MSELHADSLDQLIENADKAVSALKAGTTEWEKAVHASINLRKSKSELIAQERAFMEKCERDAEREREHQLKIEQLEEQKKSRRWECGSRCITEGIRMITYVAGTVIGLCIEKEGMILFNTNKQSHSNCMRGR